MYLECLLAESSKTLALRENTLKTKERKYFLFYLTIIIWFYMLSCSDFENELDKCFIDKVKGLTLNSRKSIACS